MQWLQSVKHNKLNGKLIRRMFLFGMIAVLAIAVYVPSQVADYERQKMVEYAELLAHVISLQGSEVSAQAYQATQNVALKLESQLEHGTLTEQKLDELIIDLLSGNTMFSGAYVIVPGSDQMYTPSWSRNQWALEKGSVERWNDPAYRVVVEKDIPQVINPIDYQLDGQEDTMTTFTAPVHVDNKPVGVVGVHLDMEYFYELADLPERLEQLKMTLVSDNGFIISSYQDTLKGRGYAAADIQMEWMDHMRKNSADLGIFEKQEGVVMGIPIHLNYQHEMWVLFMSVPAEVLHESSNHFRNTFASAAVIAILFMIVTVSWTVRRTLRPIQDIRNVMQRASEGDLQGRTAIKSCDEIQSIGDQLNELLVSLEESQGQLKNEVDHNEALNRELEMLMQENDRVYFETIKSLNKTIEAKDPYTAGHCDRVTEYAQLIGKQMGLSANELKDLTYSAILHDIGKIGISGGILTKPDKLSDKEFMEIRSHPKKGYEIIRDVHFLERAAIIAKQHHERFDGRGYPDRLIGDQIDLLARIVAVTDTYDAMTSNRSYRNAMGHKDAVAEIMRNSGTQFDPKVVQAFLAVVKQESERSA